MEEVRRARHGCGRGTGASAAKPKVVADATFFATGICRDRRNNNELRAAVDILTSDLVAAEASSLHFHVPAFVKVVQVHLDAAHRRLVAPAGQHGLSAPDVSLRQLVLALRARGDEVVLVSDDDLLRRTTEGAWHTGEFLTATLGYARCYDLLGYVSTPMSPVAASETRGWSG